MADTLVALYPSASALVGVTTTTMTVQPQAGLLLPVAPFLIALPRPKVQLLAWLFPPTGGTIEMVIAVQQDGNRYLPLMETIIRQTAPASGPAWQKVAGRPVDITAQMTGDVLSLRLLARVDTGSANYAVPTIAVLRGG